MASLLDNSALATIPSALQTLLKNISTSSSAILSPRTRLILSGAALVIVLKLLLGASSKRQKYVSDLSKVGKRVEVHGAGVEGSDTDAEYDVIIIGGGAYSGG